MFNPLVRLRAHNFIRKSCDNISDFSSRYASMYAWRVHDSLNEPNESTEQVKLRLEETKIPTISLPSDVLVKVHATSVNPLDYRMMYGYGRRFLDLMNWGLNYEPRVTNDRYPLILGRDFSGEVVAVGPHAQCQVGDTVYGSIEPHMPGAHSEFVIASNRCIAKKPSNLSHDQAASIPFTALTAYSALCCFGGLSRKNCEGKQVLVIGGSGGVGTFAIQLLKLWGASVTASCSHENTEWLENSLYVDKAINYADIDDMSRLKGKFDFVLDCGNYEGTSLTHQNIVEDSLTYLKPYNQGIYVTLSPPFLKRIDEDGIVLGSARAAFEAAFDTLTSIQKLNSARWAFYMPNKSALNYISSLLTNEEILPQIGSTFNFKNMPDAFKQLRDGKARGKIVVNVSNFNEEPSA